MTMHESRPAVPNPLGKCDRSLDLTIPEALEERKYFNGQRAAQLGRRLPVLRHALPLNQTGKELAMTEYSEKLKHPNWQRKRLEILNRDGFKCRWCCDSGSTLHVHHLRYIKGNDPWDYPDASLITLCNSCHEYEHSEFNDSKKMLVESFRDRGALSVDIVAMASAIDTAVSGDLQINQVDWGHLAGVVRWAIIYWSRGGCLDKLADDLHSKASGISS